MVRGFGLGSALRVGSWLSVWSKSDPKTAHSHLGPIGVSPEAQGQWIGRRLMDAYCNELDRTGEARYLETDRPENVTFYRQFGFEVTDEILVLGVPNHLMWRNARR
jgi:ribosomal protein S18 acetylase RimI-like enzyme